MKDFRREFMACLEKKGQAPSANYSGVCDQKQLTRNVQ
jgi:hypothetical protein